MYLFLTLYWLQPHLSQETDLGDPESVKVEDSFDLLSIEDLLKLPVDQ